MTAQNIKLVKECIAHWERMRDAENPVIFDEQPTAEHCALCRVYSLPAEAKNCDGCPVKERTKQTGCSGTPYGKARAIWDDLHKGIGSIAEWRAAVAQWRTAAQSEIDFLKSLLPEGER